eukprot:jgi/Chlat1/8928/Chrsp92S08235
MLCQAAGSWGLLPHQQANKDKEAAGAVVENGGQGAASAREIRSQQVYSFHANLLGAVQAAPCYVFQVFCVGLWCLDELWRYPLFILTLLLMFELLIAVNAVSWSCGVCEPTHPSSTLSAVASESACVLLVYRWVKVKGEELLPGDLVSIGMLLVREVRSELCQRMHCCCVASALPMRPSSPGSLTHSGNLVLNVQRDKLSVLVGGTKILQQTPDKDARSKAPDGGCIAVILRTFDTQGKLMRILFSTETMSANNLESGLFILVLLVFEGVSGADKPELQTRRATCLWQVEDPLENAALHVAWIYTGSDVVASKRSPTNTIRKVHRDRFLSQLKRSSVIARMVKADAMLQRCAYKYLTRQGARVLALGYRCISDTMVSGVKASDRDEVERDPTFGGFAVFSCSLTLIFACVDGVPRRVHVVMQPVLVLTQWAQGHPALPIAAAAGRIKCVAASFDLCVAGDGLTMLDNIGALADVVPHVQVVAQVSPEQTEVILTTLKAAGRVTLICSDGTNNAGGLKQASVIALWNAPPPKKKPPAKTQRQEWVCACGLQSTAGEAAKDAWREQYQYNSKRQAQAGAGQALAMVKDKEEEMAQADKLLVQLGDASVDGMPIHSKAVIVMPVAHSIRQGRPTLITTLQLFKILGLQRHSYFISKSSPCPLSQSSALIPTSPRTWLFAFASSGTLRPRRLVAPATRYVHAARHRVSPKLGQGSHSHATRNTQSTSEATTPQPCCL